ncbi:MAG TPA: hypothetical protein VN520_23145 [Streptomyces sp.]|uniref:hypothetical protein n=1 Tax=Streptomyces sp. TaxID=1931 RepID=UPI002BDB8BD1|nr:hypothetical protein [Streptomyces sp.]HWU09241.1 hypothetical protein [Streptomyces sp.]
MTDGTPLRDRSGTEAFPARAEETTPALNALLDVRPEENLARAVRTRPALSRAQTG